MMGMNRTTGTRLDEAAHIRQSIADILTTPLGSRIMRRDYGSLLPELIDQPQNAATHLQLMAATVDALLRWEPRVQLHSVRYHMDGPALTLDVEGEYQGSGQPFSQQIPLRNGVPA